MREPRRKAILAPPRVRVFLIDGLPAQNPLFNPPDYSVVWPAWLTLAEAHLEPEGGTLPHRIHLRFQ
jgi:hypothetical protein